MPTKSAPTRIQLIHKDGRQEEGRAAGAITPGMLIALDSSGTYVVHATAGGYAEKLFALEDALQGKTIADAYASGDLVSIGVEAPGNVVYAWLKLGQNVTPADFLTSNGDGRLKKATSTDQRIAKPLESLDLTNTGDDETRIRVRIL